MYKLQFKPSKFNVIDNPSTCCCTIECSIIYKETGMEAKVYKFLSRGTARKALEDEFDMTVGKNLSESRAKKQAYKKALRWINMKNIELYNAFKFYCEGKDFEENLQYYKKEEENHINYLKNENMH